MGYTFGSIVDSFDLKSSSVERIDLTGRGESPSGTFFTARRWSDAGEKFEEMIVNASGKPKKEVYGRGAAPTCAYKITNNKDNILYVYFEGAHVYFASGINGISGGK